MLATSPAVASQLRLQALAERRQLKDHKRQLTALRQYQAELSEEAQEQAARRERKAAVRADRALHLPPRLGKHKFQPESTQVLPQLISAGPPVPRCQGKAL